MNDSNNSTPDIMTIIDSINEQEAKEIDTLISNDPSIPKDIPSTQDIMQHTASNMEVIFEATRSLLDTIPQHERITKPDAYDKVAAAVPDQKRSMVELAVSLYLDQCVAQGIGELSQGKFGGYFPGGRLHSVDTRPRCPECHQVIREISRFNKFKEKPEVK